VTTIAALLQVLAAVSFCIANIAKDKENLAVITDHGVIHKYVWQSFTLQKFYLCLCREGFIFLPCNN
jgi:hypothetical protein